MASSATVSASPSGKPYTPEEISGKATLRQPSSFAVARETP